VELTVARLVKIFPAFHEIRNSITLSNLTQMNLIESSAIPVNSTAAGNGQLTHPLHNLSLTYRDGVMAEDPPCLNLLLRAYFRCCVPSLSRHISKYRQIIVTRLLGRYDVTKTFGGTCCFHLQGRSMLVRRWRHMTPEHSSQ
jgi:hypothetical protein